MTLERYAVDNSRVARGQVRRYAPGLHERGPVRVVDDADRATELSLHLLRPLLATWAARIAMHQNRPGSHGCNRHGERYNSGEKAGAGHICS